MKDRFAVTIGAPFKGVQHLESQGVPFDSGILSRLINGFINGYGAIETRPPVQLKWTWTGQTMTFNCVALIEANTPASDQTFFLVCEDGVARRANSTGITDAVPIFVTGTTTVTIAQVVRCAGRVVGTIGKEFNAYAGDTTLVGCLFNLDDNRSGTRGQMTVRTLGVRAGTTATLSTTGTGVLTGVFAYRLAYENWYGSIGNVGPTRTVTATANQVVVSWNTNHPETNNYKYVRIYRTLELTLNPNSDFYFIGTATITSSFIDNTPDSKLTDTSYFTDHFMPPVPAQVIASGMNRLAIAYNGVYKGIDRTGVVYFSRVNDPDVFDYNDASGAGTAIRIFEGVQDEITGIHYYRGRWLIWTRTSLYALYGDTSETFQLVKISGDVGCIAPYSIREVEGVVFWLGWDSIYSCNGAEITNESRYLRRLLEVNEATKHKVVNYRARTEYWRKMRQLWFFMREPDGFGSVNSVTVFINDLNIGALGWTTASYGAYDFATTTDRSGDIYGFISRNTVIPAPNELRRILLFTGSGPYVDFHNATTATASVTLDVLSSTVGDFEMEQEISRVSIISSHLGTITMTVFAKDASGRVEEKALYFKPGLSEDSLRFSVHDAYVNTTGNQFEVSLSHDFYGATIYGIRLFSLRDRGGSKRHAEV